MSLPEEYRNYLQDNLSLLERLNDRFSGTDERLDYAVSHIANLQKSVDNLMAIQQGGVMLGKTEQVKIEEELTALTGDLFTTSCPFDGELQSVRISFPDGCNNKVSVAIGYGDQQSTPREGSIALNGVSPEFSTRGTFISKGTLLWSRIENGDEANPHTISCIFTLQERL